MPNAERVGFVGLGNMGWPMALNLVRAGHTVTVHDVDPDVQARFAAEHGATAATTPEDFADVELVVTMLPDDKVVHAAVVDWGLADALPSGAVVIDMSSSNPTGTKALGAELAARGLALVDAPVSGGKPRAELGTLSIMIGGDDEDAIARSREVLEVLGAGLFRTGPLGSGHAMKALNNLVSATAYTVTAEALAIGLQFGLDPQVMIDVINTSTGRSFASEVVYKDHVLPGGYATGFQLGLLAKDVGIAADLAETSGVDAPTCDVVSRRWAEAAADQGGAADHAEAHKTWWTADFSPGDARVARS